MSIARLRAAAARLAKDVAAAREAPGGPANPAHLTTAELLDVVFPGVYPRGMTEAEAVRHLDAVPPAVLGAAEKSYTRIGLGVGLLIRGLELPAGLTDDERELARGYHRAVVATERALRERPGG